MSSKVYSSSKSKNGFKSLLIIESDEILSKGLMIGLIDIFEEIRIALNPTDALNLITGKEFDVIITAVEFQIYDGIKFLQSIRKLNRNAMLITVSSTSEKILSETIKHIGIDRHFEKPFELKKMISYIKENTKNKLKEKSK
ncbi:response regulator PleD [bacterium BMS3Abin04]|nr:response regulator PleD [bacterium BMS3Abin04]